MEWYEKDASFEQRARTAKSLWRYIPKKYRNMLQDARIESDGYWIYLENGYRAYDGGEDCAIIHEYNLADLKAALKTIQYYG